MKILFIQTGGTIDKDYPKNQKGWAFEITTPAFERILKNLKVSFEYECVSLFKKDSQKITDNDRKQLLDYIQKSEYSKIVITHGTDTIQDTGLYLVPVKNKTIVLTGAFLPERFKDSDAGFNLGMAVATALNQDNGIYICINGIVSHPENLKRNVANGKYYGL